MLTAAHCVCIGRSPVLKNIETIRLIFDFNTSTDGSAETPLTAVYSIKQVAAYRSQPDADWAVLELDRPVEGRSPLELNWYDDVQTETERPADSACYMLGHPETLPKKITCNGTIKRKTVSSFYTNLDAFGGNSGSPVFSLTTSKVIGILCRGDADFDVTDNYKGRGEQRVVINRVDEANEMCQKIQAIDSYVQYYCFIKVRLNEWKNQPIAKTAEDTQNDNFFTFCEQEPKDIKKSIEKSLKSDPKQQCKKYRVSVRDISVTLQQVGLEENNKTPTTAKKITLTIGTLEQLKNFFKYFTGKRKGAMAGHTGLSRIAGGNNIVNFFANIIQDPVAIEELNHCYERGMNITLIIGAYDNIKFVNCKLGSSPLSLEYRLVYYVKNKISRIFRQHRGFTNPELDRAYYISDINYRIQMASERARRLAEASGDLNNLKAGGGSEDGVNLHRRTVHMSQVASEGAKRELIQEIQQVSTKLKLPVEAGLLSGEHSKWEAIVSSESYFTKWIAQLIATIAVEQTKGVHRDKAAKTITFHYADPKENAKRATLRGVESNECGKKLQPRIKRIFKTTYSHFDELQKSFHAYIKTAFPASDAPDTPPVTPPATPNTPLAPINSLTLASTFISEIKRLEHREEAFQTEYMDFRQNDYTSQKKRIKFLLENAKNRFQSENKISEKTPPSYLINMLKISQTSIFAEEDQIESSFKKLMTYVKEDGRKAYRAQFILSEEARQSGEQAEAAEAAREAVEEVARGFQEVNQAAKKATRRVQEVTRRAEEAARRIASSSSSSSSTSSSSSSSLPSPPPSLVVGRASSPPPSSLMLFRAFMSEIEHMQYQERAFPKDYASFRFDPLESQKNKIQFLLEKAVEQFQERKGMSGKIPRICVTNAVQLSLIAIFKEDRFQIDGWFKKLMTYIEEEERNAYRRQFLSSRVSES